MEKRLEARNGLHNIGNIAIKPYLMINKAIMSSCKLSKREIFFAYNVMQQQNNVINIFISSAVLNVKLQL